MGTDAQLKGNGCDDPGTSAAVAPPAACCEVEG